MNKTAVTISKAVGGAGAVALISLAAVFGVNQLRTAQSEAEQTKIQQIEQAEQEAQVDALVVKFSSPAETTATKTPSASPVVEAPPVEEPVYVPEITYCPEGTVAGAVDDQGNESACQALSDGGEQCVAYDDANNCTQWYKP